jgi:signal transduction histidine kinase
VADRWQGPASHGQPWWQVFHDAYPRFNTPEELFGEEVASRLAAEHDVRHLVSVPLLAAGQVLGVLVVATAREPEFAADDPDLLTQVGILLGGSVHLSQLVLQLEEQRALAVEASRLKSEFLANTSHELRTPLTSILGFLRLVMDGAVAEAEKQREFLKIAHASAEKLLTIINDVLDLAKIEAGRLEVFEAPVPVRRVIRDAERLFRHQMKSKGLVFQIEDNAANHVLWADPDRSLQILTNLLGNAIKFTPAGGTITMATRFEGGQVVFTVSDTGQGMPADQVDKIFVSFYQVDGSTTRQHGGTGLGLTISRRLAELMGGGLTLESAGIDQGTTASLRLGTYSGEERGPSE